MKGIIFIHELRPYRYGMVISIGQSDADFLRDYTKLDKSFKAWRIEEVKKEVVKSVTYPGYVQRWPGDCILRIKRWPKKPDDWGVVVHECLHAVSGCMKSRGMTITHVTGEEAYCYLLEELYITIQGRVRAYTAS